MGMVVRTNTMAINAYRQLNMNQTRLAKSLEKLASGFRVNRAADDAAGLAISEKMKAQIAGLEAASANALDGISLIQTAEGALTEVHNMLNRMITLATKSANGTFDNDVDRKAIQAEVNALLDEINRIGDSANFNGIQLLDGSLTTSLGAQGKVTLVGSKVNAPDVLEIGSVYVPATTAVYMFAGTPATGQLPNVPMTEKGILEFFGLSKNEYAVNVLGGSWDKVTITAKVPGADPNREMILSKAKSFGNAYEFRVGADAYFMPSITVGSLATDLTLIGEKITVNGHVYTFVGKNDLLMGVTTFYSDGTLSNADRLADGSYAIWVPDPDGGGGIAASLAANIMDAVNKVEANIKEPSAWATDSGQYIGTDPTNMNLVPATMDAGKYGDYTVVFDPAKFTVDPKFTTGGLRLQVGDTNDEFNMITVSVDNMKVDGLGLTNLDVSTQDAAGNAIATIKAAINKVSTNRANLGALQNRLEYTINNLDVMAENMMAANSRIRDTDMAKEMMEYTKMSILVQSAMAMLAQANMQPQSILQLLQ